MIVAESRGVGGERSLLGTAPPPTGAELLRWSRFVSATAAEGPGVRAAVWVQGCAVHCPGCFNPHLWATRGAHLDDPAALAAEWVDAAVSAGAEGITLLGGEPFDQAAALAVVAEAFRVAGLGVMAFSGYTLERLREWGRDRPDLARLLAATDLLCDGPYLADSPDTRRPWIGSRNQSIRALTPRYAVEVERIARDGGGDALEVRIGADGSVAVNGWATDAALAALLDDLGVRGDRAASLRKEPSR
ncbi:4Fe-4S single cluster domain-containing protein [Microbacterium oleivorans]|uniref:4Fe-4S single cluster domain-containing protein n=1 Tax=Microbacterium oleivorans TaxID=273677 RepID=UPI00203C1095|nr:4Fe-4S single cluster domain-containing protein [Microbacterium oleivorans]MCM3695007.1 radical SAM protein [Microbacterium oleivorans]